MPRMKKKNQTNQLSSLMSHLDIKHFNQNFKKVPTCTGDPKLKKISSTLFPESFPVA